MKIHIMYEAKCNLPFGIFAGDLFTKKEDLFINEKGEVIIYNPLKDKDFFKIRKESYLSVTVEDVIDKFSEMNSDLYYEMSRECRYNIIEELMKIDIDDLTGKQIKNIIKLLRIEDQDILFVYLVDLIRKYDTINSRVYVNLILEPYSYLLDNIEPIPEWLIVKNKLIS